MQKAFLAAALAAAVALSGCAAGSGSGGIAKRDAGAVLGAIIGVAAGSKIGKGDGRTAAMILGALGGAALGQRIGAWLDEVDRARVAYVLDRAPTGTRVSWRSRTGARIAVEPGPQFQARPEPEAARTECREYTVLVEIGGRPERVHGTACRQPDGSWRAV